MSNISIELMNEFKYLSNLKNSEKKDKLIYVLSTVNYEENKYDKNIYMYDGKKHTRLTSLNVESNYRFLDNDTIYYPIKKLESEKKEDDKIVYYKLSLNRAGEALKFAEFDIPVNDLRVIDENTYILSVSYSLEHPNFYLYSKDEKEKIKKEEKELEFRNVIDEIPFWNDGGSLIRKKRNAIFKYDVSSGSCIPLTNLDGENASLEDIKDGKILINASKFTNKNSKYSYLYEINLKDLSKKELIEDNKLGISLARYFKDGIYILASDMRKLGINQNNSLYILDKNNQLKIYFDEDISYGNATGSDARFGYNESFYVEYETGKIYSIVTRGYYSELVCIENGKLIHLIDGVSSIDGFAFFEKDIYTISFVDSKLNEIYKGQELIKVSSYNDKVMEGKYVAEPIEIDFNSNGDDIKGFVLLPENFDNNRKYPAILDIHGGPKTVYSKQYYHEMQVWVSKGYVVMFTNPHGSSGRGDIFSDIRGKYGSIDYQDLMKFVDVVLKNYPNIDSDNLAVTGGSYGGFMTNWIITHTNRFKVAATQRSISNWISMYGVSDIGYYFSDDQNDAILPTEKGFEKIWEHSPLKYIENAKTPTLIIHSDADYRCPIDQGYQLLTALKDLGIDSKMVVFKGESHGLSRGGKPKARIERLNEITNWFEKYIKKN